eukprot:g9023.t1
MASYKAAVAAVKSHAARPILEWLALTADDTAADDFTSYVVNKGKTRGSTHLGLVLEKHFADESAFRASDFYWGALDAIAKGAREYLRDLPAEKASAKDGRIIDAGSVAREVNIPPLFTQIVEAFSMSDKDAARKLSEIQHQAQDAARRSGGKGTETGKGKMNGAALDRETGKNKGKDEPFANNGKPEQGAGAGGAAVYGKDGMKKGKGKLQKGTEGIKLAWGRQLMQHLHILLLPMQSNRKEDPWNSRPSTREHFWDNVIGDTDAKNSSPKVLLGRVEWLASVYRNGGVDMLERELTAFVQGVYQKISNALADTGFETSRSPDDFPDEWRYLFNKMDELAFQKAMDDLGKGKGKPGLQLHRLRTDICQQFAKFAKDKTFSKVTSGDTGAAAELEQLCRMHSVLGAPGDHDTTKQLQQDLQALTKSIHTSYCPVLIFEGGKEEHSHKLAPTEDMDGSGPRADALKEALQEKPAEVEKALLVYFWRALLSFMDDPEMRAGIAGLEEDVVKKLLLTAAAVFADKVRDDQAAGRATAMTERVQRSVLDALRDEVVDKVLRLYLDTSLTRCHLRRPLVLWEKFKRSRRGFRASVDAFTDVKELQKSFEYGATIKASAFTWSVSELVDHGDELTIVFALSGDLRTEFEEFAFWELFVDAYPAIAAPRRRALLRNAKNKPRTFQVEGDRPLSLYQYCEELTTSLRVYDSNGREVGTHERTAMALLCFGGWYFMRRTQQEVKDRTDAHDFGSANADSAAELFRAIDVSVGDICGADAVEAQGEKAVNAEAAKRLRSFLMWFVGIKGADLGEEPEKRRRVEVDSNMKAGEQTQPAPADTKYTDVSSDWVDRVRRTFLTVEGKRTRARDYKECHWTLLTELLLHAKELNGNARCPTREGVHDGTRPSIMMGVWAHIGSAGSRRGCMVLQATEEMPELAKCLGIGCS